MGSNSNSCQHYTFQKKNVQLLTQIYEQSRFFLTFRRPCFVIHSYNKGQRDAQFLKFI